jgi:hypothetical protein
MDENGMNFLKKGEAEMTAMNEAAWIDANIELIENYLQKEFENFAVAHRADKSLTHIFTVHNGKKRFRLSIGWPILVDRSFAQAGIGRLLNENVAGEMRLHGEDGYHWRPSHENATQQGDL